MKTHKNKFSSFKDARDGQTYQTVQLMGKTWMAQNLNFDLGNESWLFDDNPENGKKYGRLYSWEAANEACPAGWRLPTNLEWFGLIRNFNGQKSPLEKNSRNAYSALIDGGSSGFAVTPGGYRTDSGKFTQMGQHGNFWTGSAYDHISAWFYWFFEDERRLGRYILLKTNGLSVRCIKG